MRTTWHYNHSTTHSPTNTMRGMNENNVYCIAMINSKAHVFHPPL